AMQRGGRAPGTGTPTCRRGGRTSRRGTSLPLGTSLPPGPSRPSGIRTGRAGAGISAAGAAWMTAPAKTGCPDAPPWIVRRGTARARRDLRGRLAHSAVPAIRPAVSTADRGGDVGNPVLPPASPGDPAGRHPAG